MKSQTKVCRAFAVIAFGVSHCFSGSALATVRFVDSTASGANNGKSWSDAYVDLQNALAASIATDEIWVAQGTYKPSVPNGSRNISFPLRDQVTLYGGFPAGGGAFDDRDPTVHLTILSGDLNGDDGPPGTFTNNGDNSYHVLRDADSGQNDFRIDGFIIQGGNANGIDWDNRGGGILVSGMGQRLFIHNCVIQYNYASQRGAGLYMSTSNATSPNILEVAGSAIVGNVASDGISLSGEGGGVYCSGPAVYLWNTTFELNTGQIGGGAYLDVLQGDAFIYECEWVSNSVKFQGGGLYITGSSTRRVNVRSNRFVENTTGSTGSSTEGGGLYLKDVRLNIVGCQFLHNQARTAGGGAWLDPNASFSATIANCDFRGNQCTNGNGGGLLCIPGAIQNCAFIGNSAAAAGGGLHIAFSTGLERKLVNCTIAGNVAGTVGGGVGAVPSNFSIHNSVLWQNSDSAGMTQSSQINGVASINYTTVHGWDGTWGGTGNNGSDPLFVDLDGADNTLGNEDDDVRVQAGSPAIDSANNTVVGTDVGDLDFNGDTNQSVPIDLGGIARFQDDPTTTDTGSGTPPIVDRGAYEFGQAFSYVTFTGVINNDWNNAANWSSGRVPDESTNVILATTCQIVSGNFHANQLCVADGGTLALSGGYLTALSVVVENGGLLTINDATATVDTHGLNIQPGGTLAWISGTIVINGGGWSSLEPISIGCSGSASLVLKDNAQIVATSVQVCNLGTLAGHAKIIGNVTNSGLVQLLVPNDRLDIEGNYTQMSSGTLEYRLGGHTNDPLIVFTSGTSNVTLAGTLKISIEPSYAHLIGERYTSLWSPSIMGTFSTIVAPALPNGTMYVHQSASNTSSFFAMLGSTGSRLYVKADSALGGNGQSWKTALHSITGALEVAAFFPNQIMEIWVAQGTYKPTKRTEALIPRTARFTMVSGASIYGGFVGTESALQERDWKTNLTILSGDLLGDDQPGFVNIGDNVYSVIVSAASNISAGTVIDGFTIQSGNATAIGQNSGAGMRVTFGTPTIRHCNFWRNSAVGGGGGLACSTNSLVDSCQFVENRAFGNAGGASLGSAFPVIRNSWFESNVAAQAGGGLFAGGTRATITGCTFVNNVSESQSDGGGGLWCGNADVINCAFFGNRCRLSGAGVLGTGNGSTVVANCIFSGNSAGVNYPASSLQQGSGIAVFGSGVHAIVNSTFSQNTSAAAGGAIYTRNSGVTANIANCVLWGNSNPNGSNQTAQISGTGPLTLTHSNVQGWTGSLGGVANTGDDPLLLSPLGSDGSAGTIDDDLRLAPVSPCIDAGSNPALPQDTLDLDGDGFMTELLPIDFDLNHRMHDDPLTVDTGSGTAPLTDRGAFEFGSSPAGAVIFVGSAGGSWFAPGNWSMGNVPTPQSNVVINTTVVIDGPNAAALSVLLQSGGNLVISGSLATESVLVQAGATLQLAQSSSLLSVGTLTLQNGSILQWNAGTIQVSQNLTSPLALSVGCSGSATLLLLPGSTISATSVNVCSSGVVAGTGSIASAVTNEGTLSPGASIGTLTINGNFTQTSGGSLVIELAGVGSQEIDRVVVGGNATVAGTLDIDAISSFEPSLIASQFMAANQVIGTFETTNLPPLNNNFSAFVQYQSTSVKLFMAPPGPRLYVNAANSVGGAGASWETAVPSVAMALQAAAFNGGAISELWVAQGIYTPTTGSTNPRTGTFELLNGVSVYGGFAGHETQLEQRDFENNVTVLSGDLNGDDGPNFTNRADNVYHVASANGINATAVLDGFTIRGGQANGSFENEFGGGLYCVNSNPVISNCIITSNVAADCGGGVYRTGAAMTFTNCVFLENTTEGGEGGGVLIAGTNTVTFQSCYFIGNSSDDGGGLMLEEASSANLQNCTFEQNLIDGLGAGVFNQGGNLIASGCSFTGNAAKGVAGGGAVVALGGTVSLDNCEFAQNTATNGGALGLHHSFANSPTINNCTFHQNVATQSGGAVAIDPGLNVPISPVFTNCTFTENTAYYRGGAVVAYHQLGNSLNPMFNNCTFAGNHVTGLSSNEGQGGAIWATTGIPTTVNGPKLNECTFTANTATREGGAIRVAGATIALDDCTFSQNDAPVGTAIYNVSVGTVRGNADFEIGQTLTSGSGVRPGLPSAVPPVGTLVFNGTLEFIDRGPPYFDQPSLFIDVGGTTPAIDFDYIDAVNGNAALTGALYVNFVNGFTPRIGDEFEIVASSNVNGQFTVALFPIVPPGMLMRVDYGGDGVSLVVDPIDGIVHFNDPQASGVLGSPIGAELGDLDNDGDVDLVVCARAVPPATIGNVYVLLNGGNDGQGKWLGFTSVSPAMPVGAGPVSLALGRFDSDAYLDIAVANRSGNSITKYPNNATGNGSFGTAVTASITSPTAIARGRLFNTWDDLVVTTQNGDVVVQSFTASGSFAAGPTILAGGIGPKDVATTDLDNDGDQDIVVLNVGSNTTIGVHEFDSNTSTFRNAIQYPGTTLGIDLHLDDLNADGFSDVIVSHSGGSASILINQGLGDATLAAAVAVPVGTTLSSIATLDIDDDGDQDIVTVVGAGPSALVRLARNDLNGGQTVAFSQFSDLITGEQSVLVRSGDLNGDAVDDLLCIDVGAAAVDGFNDTIVAARINETTVPACPADIAPPGGDGLVNVADLLAVIGGWGACQAPCPPSCNTDVNGDCTVNVSDLLAVISGWGVCPD